MVIWKLLHFQTHPYHIFWEQKNWKIGWLIVKTWETCAHWNQKRCVPYPGNSCRPAKAIIKLGVSTKIYGRFNGDIDDHQWTILLQLLFQEVLGDRSFSPGCIPCNWLRQDWMEWNWYTSCSPLMVFYLTMIHVTIFNLNHVLKYSICNLKNLIPSPMVKP
jgi:hypothetical protein